MAGADVVVAQGGPGGIMDARSVGRQPVAVPRRGDLGEHVDDHQVRFTAWMADRGLVRLADDEAALIAELDAGLADPSRLRIPPDGGAIDDTITAFRAVVDPLLATRRSRRTR
jgi:UDP-N-acetylglucosamine transferase subunit ALG13